MFASWLVMVTFLHHTELQVPWYSDDKWDNVRGEFQNFFIFTSRKRSLGQGNVFTSMCHSVHRGGGRPGGLGRLPRSRSPRSRPPRQTLPGCRPPGIHQQAGGTHPTGMHSCCTQFQSRQTQRLYSSDAPEPVIETLLLLYLTVYMIYFLTNFSTGYVICL